MQVVALCTSRPTGTITPAASFPSENDAVVIMNAPTEQDLPSSFFERLQQSHENLGAIFQVAWNAEVVLSVDVGWTRYADSLRSRVSINGVNTRATKALLNRLTSNVV